MTRKNYCFIHSCNLPDTGTVCLEYLLERIKILPFEKIFINNIGIPIEKEYPGAEICNYSTNVDLFETPTINLVRQFAIDNPGHNVLYLHTKGITRNYDDSRIQDWIDMMLHFLIDERCIELLNQYDTLGCNLTQLPVVHYSGNFWWATTDYLSKLPVCGADKYASEMWLQPRTNSLALHNSGIIHYWGLYPKNKYN